MPVMSFLFGEKKQTIIDAMALDAAIQVTHEFRSSPTRHEVEEGVDITDHIRREPAKLTIEGMISDSPITTVSMFTGLAASAVGQGVTYATGTGYAGVAAAALAARGAGTLAAMIKKPPRSPKDAFRYLEEKWKEGRPFTVVTSMRKYDNMVFTTISVPRNAEVGGSLVFTATLEEIRIAKTMMRNIPAVPAAAGVSPGGTVQAGNLPTTAATEATAKAGKSLLVGISDAATKAIRQLKAIVAGVFTP